MADTITILNALTHTQETTQSATLFDMDDPIASVVGTWAIHVPLSASQVRVIFNNTYDLSGSPVMGRVRVTKTTGMTTTGVTKTETTQAMEWTYISQVYNKIGTGTIDVSGSRDTTLHIDCCIVGTGAHAGTEIIVQIASEAGVDDAWTDIARFIGPAGTAIAAILPSNEAAGQTVISITDPVTNNFDNDCKFKFMMNDTVANAEIVYQISNSGD